MWSDERREAYCDRLQELKAELDRVKEVLEKLRNIADETIDDIEEAIEG